MKIKDDHRLYHDDDTPYPFAESPNTYPAVQHDYLVWHYTANNNGASAVSVLSTLKTPKSHGVSAHLVIDLDGTITQLVPFDKGAWHAGESHYELTEKVPVLEDTGRTPVFKYPARHPADPVAAKTDLTVKKIEGDWALVKIKKEKDGWIALSDLDLKSKTKAATRVRAAVYAFQPNPLPPSHGVKTLPKGFPVRILREEKAFVLIANLKDVPNFKVVQGWVPSGTLKRNDG